MRLVDIRVRNYRTVGAEQTLRLPSGITLVGPNNSGKTNLLRSIQLFFTGYDNTLNYDRGTDLTFGAGSQKTSLVATFEFDGHDRDEDVRALLTELHDMVGTKRDGERFSVNLYFTEVSTPVYRVFGNAKVLKETDRPNFSRKQKQLVETLMRTFRIHYVPSAKSIDGLYTDLLQPFLTKAANEAIAPHIDLVRVALTEVSQSLNRELASVGLSGIEADFNLESDAAANMLSGFELMLSDPSKTSLSEKGQGIQSTALFASFNWIAAQEQASGQIPLWLIEEPESYLHPELSKSCRHLLMRLADSSQVVLTTHALGFVPTNIESVQGVDLDERGHTVVTTFPSHAAATSRIRTSLGVQFSDYYNLATTNVFVEGPSDRQLINWAVKTLTAHGHAFPLIAESLIEDFGGVKQLEGFLKAVLLPVRTERALVSVLDGDDAGQRTRQALQQFFGQKDEQFEANRDFVSVRSGFSIEALFPDQWVIDLHNDHAGWFETFSVDASGELEPFRVKTGNKTQLQNALTARASQADPAVWAGRWLPLLSTIEASLQEQLTRLGLDSGG